MNINMTWPETLNAITPGNPEHNYIISTDEPNKFSLINKKDLKPTDNKLTIFEIVNISKEKIKEKAVLYSQNKIADKKFTDYTTRLKDKTTALIEARVAKRNSNWNKGLRTAAFIISIVLTATVAGALLGLPILFTLRKSDRNFINETQQLKDELLEIFSNSKNKIDKEKIKLNIRSHPQGSLIRSALNEDIECTIQKLSEDYTDANRLEWIQNSMTTQFKEFNPVNNQYVPQFKKDIPRGITFKRFETHTKFPLSDFIPLPIRLPQNIQENCQLPKEVINKNLLINAVNALSTLMVHDEDRKWKYPMQLIPNQTSLNTIFDPIIMMINIKLVEKERRWDENGKAHVLQVKFSENSLPLIELTVIRDPEEQYITRFNVSLSGQLDLMDCDESKSRADVLIAPNVIGGKLDYSFTLDEHEQPLIQNLITKINVETY